MTAPQPSVYNFDSALALAMRVHAGQLDKAGEPYILHPIRVAMRLQGPMLRVVALLHDTLEDCRPMEPNYLKFEIIALFGGSVLALIEGLTRGEEPYEEYIEQMAGMPLVRTVKLADLADNLDETRWVRANYLPSKKQRQRYLWARWYLQRQQIAEEIGNEALCKTPSAQMIENIYQSGVKL